MGGVVKAIVKPIKKVVKGVSKVVKSVAKSIVKVGKSVVKGVKSVVKGVGKVVSKLGPVGQIALMAVGGYFLGPMISGAWGSMGISSAIGQSMANGALTGFVMSGGDPKAALMGGVMGGLGSAGGALAKGGTQGLSQAWSAGSGVTSVTAGLDLSAQRWSNFTNTLSNTGKTITDKIGDWFSDNGTTSTEAGSAQKLTAAQTGVAANNGQALTQSQMDLQAAKTPYPDVSAYAEENMLDSAYGTPKSPTAATPLDPQVQTFMDENMLGGEYDTAARSFDPYMEQFGGTTANQAANTSLGQNFNRLVKLGQQNPNLTTLSYDNLRSSIEQFGSDKMAAATYLEDMAASWQNKGFDITPYTFTPGGQTSPIWNKDFVSSGNSWLEQQREMANYNVGAADTLGTTVEAAQYRAGLRDSVYEQPQQESLLDKGKGLVDALSKGYQAWAGSQTAGTGAAPSWVTSVPAGDTLLGKAGGVGGTAGGGVFTPEQEQYQKQLLAAIRQQEEMAKQRAAAGWGVA